MLSAETAVHGTALANAVAANAPLVIPCSKYAIDLGTGFDSSLALKDKHPWTALSALQAAPQDSSYATVEMRGDGMLFDESTSSNASNSSESLNVSLGVSVGCKALSASVSGSYAERTAKTRNATRATRNVSYRAGQIIFASTPLLAIAAQELLATDSTAFRERYGDYYVAGLQIGADAGCSLAVHSDSDSHETQLNVTVTLHVLFWDASKSFDSQDSSQTASFDMQFAAYNSLEQKFYDKNCYLGQDPRPIAQLAAECMRDVQLLRHSVKQRLRDNGIVDAMKLDMARCKALCRSGLVSQVILLPYSQLGSVIDAQERGNILRNMQA